MAENNHEANRFIYRNRPEKTDDEKERQEKQLRLDFAWENLMVCSAEELRSFKVFGSLKKFCLAQMRKKATLTVEEANRQEALLSGVIAEKYEKLEGHLGRNRGKKGWVRTFLLVYLQELEEIKKYIPLLKKYEKTAAASENAGEATICQIWGLYEDICTQEWEQIGYYLGKKHGKAAAAIESIDEILAEMEQPKEEAKESVIRLKTKLEELYRNLGADEDLAAEYMDLLSTIDPSMEKKELLCGTVLEAFDYIKKYVDYYGYQPRVDSCLRQLLQFLESCSSVKDPQQYYLEMAEFLISHYQELLHSDFERFESIRRISCFWILPALDESKKRAWTSLFLKFLELYNHPKLCWESVCWDNLKKVKQLLQESGMYEEFQSELFKISHRWIGRFIYHMEHTVLLTLKPYIVDLEENRLPLAEETKLQVLADLEDYINEKQQNSKESRAYMDRLEHAKGEEIEEIFKNRPRHSKWKHKHFKEVLI